MKIFGWMQSKLKYGKHDESNKKPNSKSVNQTVVQESGKEEVNDWLYGLLAIGTFGKNDLKEDLERINFQEKTSSTSEDHLRDPTSEEVGKLQDELNSLLMHKQDDYESASAAELEQAAFLENFLGREISLEPERMTSNTKDHSNESNTESASLQSSTSLVLSRGKDACLDNTTKNANIGKKSFSFLLKKIFVCRSGFPPSPSPKAPIPESRMEKMLIAIFHKKIYPQSSSPSLSVKKYIENKSNEDDLTENSDKGSKWVKTDSEYIVLEI